MKNIYKLISVIVFFFSINNVSAQLIGDVCSNPVIENLCTNSPFTGYNYSYVNDVSSWTVGSSNISALGRDIFYQINLPVSTYTPTSIDVTFIGYFNYQYQSNRIYFLWFDNPSCSGNPNSVDSFNVNGTLINGNYNTDSFCFSHTLTSTQSQYYLAVDFKTSETNSWYAYHYDLQLGFSNNQPLPAIICGSGVPPYEGELKLDTSICYNTVTPYHLPLSVLNDDPIANNSLFGFSSNLNYFPINDNNAIGFSLILKNQILNYYYGQNEEFFRAFNTFPYSYSTSWGSHYTVAFTVFMKNDTGASGLKGFRIQIPGLNLYPNTGEPSYPFAGDTGIYDTTGIWTTIYSGDMITWLFNGTNGRGDNVTDTGQACRVYTFSVPVGSLGNNINAWYLPDYYGTDSFECGYGPSIPPRTDCGNGCNSGWSDPGWIVIDANGTGTGDGITGVSCTDVYNYCVAGFETQCGNQYDNSYNCNAWGIPYGQNTTIQSFTPDGCINSLEISFETYQSQFLAPQMSDGTTLNEDICYGDSYLFDLDFNGWQGGTTILVYQNSSGGSWYPVNSNGTINYSVSLDPNYIPSWTFSFIQYYQYSSFSVPLMTGGTYELWTYYEIDNWSYYGENCNGDLILTVDTPMVITSIASDSICAGESVNISVTGCDTYTWSPNSAISSTVGSTVMVNPTVSTTYTVNGMDALGCTDNATVAINVTAGVLDTAFASFGSLQSRYCPNSPPVTLVPVNSGGTFSGPGVVGNTFIPSLAGIGGPYNINYSFGNCASNSQITSVENPSADINPSAPVVEACFGQAIPLTTPYDPYYSYLWKRGPFIMPGVISNTYTPIWSGTFKYTVKVTDTYGGGCVAKDSVYYHLINFPNPTLVVGPCINNTILLTSSVTDPNLNYQWVKWGTPISGATNTSYTVTSNGAYRVAITDSCGTLRFTPLTQFIISTCRSEEISDKQASQLFDVTLYPNPNEGQFTIDFIAYDFYSTEINLDIFNVLGQIVYTKVLNMNDGKLNAMIQLPFNVESGLYNVRIKKGDAETYRKIVLTK